MMTEVTIEEKNKFPVSYNSFEVHVTKRKVQYQLREIQVDEIFGHQELIDIIKWEENGEIGQKPVRQCRVYAKSASEVIYLNIEKFRQFFDEKDRTALLKAGYFYDYNLIKQKILHLLSTQKFVNAIAQVNEKYGETLKNSYHKRGKNPGIY